MKALERQKELYEKSFSKESLASDRKRAENGLHVIAEEHKRRRTA